MILFINSLTFFLCVCVEKEQCNFIDDKQNQLELQKKSVEGYPPSSL